MIDPGLLRFLEIVIRELGAGDAHLEIGGKDPTDPCVVSRLAPNGSRVVVVFDSPPDQPALAENRLDALVQSFFSTAENAIQSVPPSRTPPDIAGRRLDDELTRLSERAAAQGAVVFDLASPVLWGASHTTSTEIDRLLETAILRVRDVHAELRHSHTMRLSLGESAECIARPFAGLYVVALVFDGPVSEPVAVGALVHAMPLIERFVLALPPVDPGPGGGKVMRMPSRLR